MLGKCCVSFLSVAFHGLLAGMMGRGGLRGRGRGRGRGGPRGALRGGPRGRR